MGKKEKERVGKEERDRERRYTILPRDLLESMNAAVICKTFTAG